MTSSKSTSQAASPRGEKTNAPVANGGFSSATNNFFDGIHKLEVKNDGINLVESTTFGESMLRA